MVLPGTSVKSNPEVHSPAAFLGKMAFLGLAINVRSSDVHRLLVGRWMYTVLVAGGVDVAGDGIRVREGCTHVAPRGGSTGIRLSIRSTLGIRGVVGDQHTGGA